MGAESQIGRILGGRRALGTDMRTSAEAIEIVKRGIPTQAMGKLIAHLDVSQNEFSKITGIARRTIARRIGGARLKPDESNKVYRLASIVVAAEEAFGSEDKSRAWLNRPNRALGGVTPLQMLDTDIGTGQVRQVLGRIRYGVYS